MINVLKNDASTVFNWLDEFKRRPTDINDEACNGRPKSGTDEEIIDSIMIWF